MMKAFTLRTLALAAIVAIVPACGDSSSKTLYVAPEAEAAPTTARFVYTAHQSNAVAGFTVDQLGTGALTPVPGSPLAISSDCDNLVVDPQSRFLYGADQSNNFRAFQINQSTGALTELAGSPYTANSAYGLAIHPEGKFVYTGGSTGAYGFSIDADTGALTPIAGSPFTTSGEGRPAVSPDGKFLFVPNDGGSTLNVFSIDQSTGVLTDVAGSPFTLSVANQDACAIHPTANLLFVAGGTNADIGVYSYDANGALTEVAGSPFASGATPAANFYGIEVDPQGSYLYAVDYGTALVLGFSINTTTGALTAIPGLSAATGTGPGDLSIGPAGEYLYVANFGSGSVSVYSIDRATGDLAELVGSPFAIGAANPFGVLAVR